MVQRIKPEIFKRLTDRYTSNPVWMSLFKSVSKVVHENVNKPRYELQRIRDNRVLRRGDYYDVDTGDGNLERGIIANFVMQSNGVENLVVEVPNKGSFSTPVKSSHDREVNVSQSVQRGFNFFSDTLTDQDYNRISEWVSYYWPEGGTEDFAHFIGWFKDMRLEIHQLWSRDDPFHDLYDPLERRGSGVSAAEKPVWEDGIYFPTSHTELLYDAIHTPNPSFPDLIPMFYLLAPIHLVLERIVGKVDAPPVPMAAAASAQQTPYTSSRYKWSPDTSVGAYHGFGVNYTSYTASFLVNPSF